MQKLCIQVKNIRWPQFAIKPGKDHPKLANRLSLFSGEKREGPGIETFKFASAVVIVGAYDECLRRDIPLTGLMGQMALRDPFSPEALKEWFDAQPGGTGFSPRFPSELLTRVAKAGTKLDFIRAIRGIFDAIGVMDLRREVVNLYKPYTKGTEELLSASLSSEVGCRVAIRDYSDWIQSSARSFRRRPQKPKVESTED